MTLEINNSSITKLNGSNYLNWRYVMELLLKKEDVWNATLNEPAEAVAENWTTIDQKAHLMIALNVEDDQLQHIRECSTAKEAWKKLKDFHENKGLDNPMWILKELMIQNLENGDDIDLHIKKIKDLFQELLVLSDDIKLEFILSASLLAALPEKYNGLLTELREQKEGLTPSFICSKLIDEWQRQKKRKQDYLEGGSSAKTVRLSSESAIASVTYYEQQPCSTTPKDSLLILNDDCLNKIFQLLELDDCLNVATTCKRLKDVTAWTFHKKFSSFEFTYKTYRRGNCYIDQVFFHIGQHLKSFHMGPYDKTGYLLTKASQCKNLKNLYVRKWKLEPERCITSLCDFQHLESLSLTKCSFRYDENFFAPFSNIKCLTIINCQALQKNALQKLFENNKQIESFAFVSHGQAALKGCPLKILDLLPKLESVYLADRFLGQDSSISLLCPLTQLKGLKKLKLINWSHSNINHVLNKLDFLEELELIGFEIDDISFTNLKSFHKLELLGIQPSIHFFPRLKVEWKSTYALPANLKFLKLQSIDIFAHQIPSIIRQLPQLKTFHIHQHPCSIMDRNKDDINEFEKTVQLISKEVEVNYNPQIVNVTLVDEKYSTEEITVGHLRIFGKHPDKCSFGIDFPESKEFKNEDM